MINYHLRITYHLLQNRQTFISSELTKYGPHFLETKTLINALVFSRLDYCSSLLNLFPAKSTAPLKRIIRSSIRTTYCITQLYHSTTTSHK